MTVFSSAAQLALLPPGLTPNQKVAVAVAIVVVAFALLVLLALLLRRRPPKPPPAPVSPEELKGKVSPKAAAAIAEAERAVERARVEREAAAARAKEEQAARHAREEAARRRAEEESRARQAAEERAAEARRAGETAENEEERRRARAEAEAAAQEAARRRKDQAEAERKAEFEAKKAAEAEQRALRRAEQEAQKLEALETARREAEAAAAAEVLRQRKIEAESGRTLAEGLERTRGGFLARLSRLVGSSTQLDDQFLSELEEILFTADIGVKTAQRLLDLVREKLKNRELSDPSKVKAALRKEIENILTLGGTYEEGGMPPATASPQVVMIVGVNGSGKTTTLGKLSFKERVSGRKVLLGAGDTFRAAAAEQLDVWAVRAEVGIVKAPADSDPAAVCFEAVKKAVDDGMDLCLLDTAGRLHTKAPLMDELKKVRRVVDKAMPGAPHEVWLVVDGTTGQNALVQARQFHEALGLTGIVLTKLDGTAKGGVVIGICDELKVPVRYVGVGEKIGDLRPFSPREFVDALFAEPGGHS